MRKLFTVLSIMLLLTGTVLASFPVQKSNQTEQTENNAVITDAQNNNVIVSKSENNNIIKQNMKKKSSKKMDDKVTLILLWVFLGGFAAHRWYAKKPVGANILFIITAGGCGIWAIIDLIKILQDDFM